MKKKKLKLRGWVKVTLALFIIGILLIINGIITKNAINDCINAGFSKTYCEVSLAK